MSCASGGPAGVLSSLRSRQGLCVLKQSCLFSSSLVYICSSIPYARLNDTGLGVLLYGHPYSMTTCRFPACPFIPPGAAAAPASSAPPPSWPSAPPASAPWPRPRCAAASSPLSPAARRRRRCQQGQCTGRTCTRSWPRRWLQQDGVSTLNCLFKSSVGE